MKRHRSGTSGAGHRPLLRWGMFVVIGCIVMGVGLLPGIESPDSAVAQTVNTPDFLALIDNDAGSIALQQLAEIAADRGGWGPAPGDVIVFDPTMPGSKRASTVAIDVPPSDCESPDPADQMHRECGRDYEHQQHLVRFGVYTFVDQQTDGPYVPRALDDILSIYIEEVGHSWQEYCYETEGRCSGERTRLTTWGEGSTRVAGWEYQVKRYILSLDGSLLALTAAEHNELRAEICDGYANPIFSPVETAPPPGWPNAEGWPTAHPTAAEFEALCGDAT